MKHYETPNMEVMQLTVRETIANEEDNSVIISGGSLYPFPKK